MLAGLWRGLKALRAVPGECNEFSERRDSIRIDCSYDVDCKFADQTCPGQVTDLSLRGLRLACQHTPKVGELVELNYKAAGSVTQGVICRVAWTRADERAGQLCGLSFSLEDEARETWVKALLSELGFRFERLFQRRKFVRTDCDLTARFAYGDNLLQMGRLHNLGARGALLGLREGPEVGEKVDLLVGPLADFEGLSLGGRVVGRRDGGAGELLYSVEFEGLVDSEARLLGTYLRHLLS